MRRTGGEEILGTVLRPRWVDGELVLDMETESGKSVSLYDLSFCPNLEGFLELLGVHAELTPASVRRIEKNCVNGCFSECRLYPDTCEKKHYLDHLDLVTMAKVIGARLNEINKK